MTDQPDRPETTANARALLRRRAVRPAKRKRGTKRSFSARAARWVGGGLAVVVTIVALVAGIAASGIGGERLRQEAQRALTEMAGGDVIATIGSVRLRIDADRFLALEIAGAGLSGGNSDEPFIDVGLVRFGVRFLPLLEGRLQLANARLADARIVADRLPDRGGPGPLAGLRNEQGLLDPDLVTPAVFRAVHRLFDLVENNAARQLTLDNVTIVLDSARGTSIVIPNARLARTDSGALEMSGTAEIADRTLIFEGTASRDDQGTRIALLDLDLSFSPMAEGADKIGLSHRIAALEVSLSGAQSLSSAADRLDVEARYEGAAIDLGKETVTVSGSLQAYSVTGSNKIEIEELAVRSDASDWRFNGAIGPRPASGDDAPAYRFELVTDGSRLDIPGTDDVSTILARLGGSFEPAAQRLVLDDIGLRAGSGVVDGRAVLAFAPGKTPGLDLDLSARDVDVADAKALWPIFAAPGGRRWALENVSDGLVRHGRVQLATVPGRFGDGIPFTDEVSGRFVIEGATAHLGGELPELVDGKGVVTFTGDRLDVAVESARSQLPSGKWIAGKDAAFSMDITRGKPLVGNLVVDVDADADAALEYASLKPIDAGKHLDFKAEDLSGHMAGRVQAQFPVEKDGKDIPVTFDVALDFAELALAEPFQGQTVSEAYGSLRILPSYADIKADAKLNGVPATIALIEPLGSKTVERSRKVELNLNDAARDELIPALSLLLSGNASVALDLSDTDRQSVTADLSGSTLSLPWIGWSKGAGIAATTAFQMERNGGQTFLHGFGIEGESFAVDGEVSLDEAGLTKASFPQVRLNRGDDFSVDIARAGKGYRIGVTGKTLDARSLIKALRTTAQATGEGGGKATPIALTLSVDAVTGFGNETLRNVEIAYSGEGSSIENLSVSAITGSGAPVKVTHGIGQGGRFLRGETGDAGAVLRFLDVYGRMEGGSMNLTLRGAEGGALVGQVGARDFWIVDEPRLASLVSTPSDDRGRSLNEVVRGNLNVSRVYFDRAFSGIKQGKGYLALENGVIRGRDIGSTFQGTVYDEAGNMSMTGTFMPAYGINRLFGEIPLIGAILGNGRDRGLIGITFKLAGPTDAPQLQVNPLSAIAPGIFRSVFEFSE